MSNISGVRGGGDRTPVPVKRKFFKNHESNTTTNKNDHESEPKFVLRSEIDGTRQITMQNTREIDDFNRDMSNKFSEDNQ